MNKPGVFDSRSALLTPDARNQFARALKAQRNGLWRYYLRPNLIRADMNSYVPLLATRHTPGSNPEHLNAMIERHDSDEAMQEQSPFFLMPLRIPQRGTEYGIYGDGSPKWERPSDRLVNAGFWVFTMEIDEPNVAALEQQLAWCRAPSGKPERSPLGMLDHNLRVFQDYRGVTAVYGGNKSVHFHFVFDIRHISSALSRSDRRLEEKWQGDVSEDQLRDLYRLRWQTLAGMFTKGLDFTGDIDTRLSSPFQLRRTPWGVRVVEAGHLLNLPEGTHVSQCVLLDLVKQRSPNGATDWFMRPEQTQRIEHVVATAKPRVSHNQVSVAEAKSLLKKLEALCQTHWGTEYPKPVKLVDDGGENVVFFRNHAGDRRPSTVLRGSYRHPLFCGHNIPEGPFWLPDGLTLDETLDSFRSSGTAKPTPLSTVKPYDWWESVFLRRAHSKEAAQTTLATLIPGLTRSGQFAWIKSVEGIGKTRSLLREVPQQRYDDLVAVHLGEGESHGFLVIACRSYEQAGSMCEQFNKIHTEIAFPDSEPLFAGTVLKSFSRIYAEVCGDKKAEKLSLSEVGRIGHGSMIEAIQQEQPDIYAEMIRRRNLIWHGVNGWPGGRFDPLRTVLFTAHSLVHNWGQQSITRAWLHPDFDSAQGDPSRIDLMQDQLKISKLIYDEISLEDLIDIIPRPVWAWCRAVKKRLKRWDKADLGAQLRAYEGLLPTYGYEQEHSMTFEECRRIIAEGYSQDDVRRVNTTGIEFGNDHDETGLYRGQNGSEFILRPRRWWDALGGQVIVLTTEEIPTRIAESLRFKVNRTDSATGKITPADSKFRVLRFDQVSGFLTETALLVLDDRAAADRPDKPRISALASEIHEKHPGTMIISDGLGGSPGTITHHRGKGRNDLWDRDLVTVLMYLSPDVYARLCLLAQEFNIPDIIRTHYRDVLFQALGRNRGMRRHKSKPTKHEVIMSGRLYRDLGMKKLTEGHRYSLIRRPGLA
jgi:hypothetical protein